MLRAISIMKMHILHWSNFDIAYEPVWAIGTGKAAIQEIAQETYTEIREWLKANISADAAAVTRIR